MKLLRWLFRRCMDCGIKLGREYDRGDVCWGCLHYDGFVIIREIFRHGDHMKAPATEEEKEWTERVCPELKGKL